MENYKPKSKGARRIAIEIEKGITDPKEIAENTGYKLSTVLQYLSLYFPTERVRSTKRKGKMISETTKLIIERLENGELQSNIAREFGVTRQRVYRIRKNFVDTKEEVQNEKDTINGLRCLAGERPCDLCKYDDMAMNDGERTCINFVTKDALDLIYRLQDENERLTRELNDTVCMNEMYIKEVRQNAELQKQVDELKKSGNGVLLTSLYKKQADDHKRGLSVQRAYWKKKLQQVEKDTAKEIYKEIGKGDILVVQTQEYGEIEVVSIERLKEIIKQKGVEVE